MTKLATIGLVRDQYHRYSWNGGPMYPGVTSVIGVLDKPGLKYWAAKVTAEAAVRDLDLLARMVKAGGPTAAAAFVKSLPEFERDASASLGSRIHAIAEALARKEDVVVAEDEAPYITSYLRWMDEHKPTVTAAEFMVYSETHQYGGTADVAWNLDGFRWLVDYKTGKGVYDSTGLQLVGLDRADWAGKPGDPKKYKVPRAEKFGVLHILPDGAELVPFDITGDEWETFIACRRIHRWNKERVGKVKGPTQIEVAA